MKRAKNLTTQITCPVYYLGYIINGDSEGLEEHEIKEINDTLEGYEGFSSLDDTHFSHINGFNQLGGDCVTLIMRKTNNK